MSNKRPQAPNPLAPTPLAPTPLAPTPLAPTPEFVRRFRAYKRAEKKAEQAGAMTPAERKAFLVESKYISKECSRQADAYRAEYAPTMASVESDLLKLLMIVGAEFIAKYYPNATSANFYVSFPNGDIMSRTSVSIPMPTPAAGEKGKVPA